MRLYRDYAKWYRLVDPPADHEDEADHFRVAFEKTASPRPETLLELGSGAGHNALHLKRRFRCTLTDLSEEMLALSRELNPECEHIAGDMRTLELHRTFDVVLVHDAVTYMTTESDLAAAARTAFIHTRPGGAAIFAPDRLRETFTECTETESGEDATRTLHYLAWTWDPDPTDETYSVEYAFLIRENGVVQALHEHHIEGLFSRATWLRVLDSVGFASEIMARPIGGSSFDEVFLCRKP
ncbi:MAG: class I SAM-dependent methyltransferase [Polyangiaceae bacterium]